MKRTNKRNEFAPAKWQWDPMSVTTARVQFWSEGGSLTMIDLDTARDLIGRRAAFAGSSQHICQVHDRIDACNA